MAERAGGGTADYSAASPTSGCERDEELFWPCGEHEHHTARRGSSSTTFATPDGRARFAAGRSSGRRPRSPTRRTLYRLTTGRVLAQYQSGAQTRRVGVLNDAAPEPFVELHPDLARRLGVAEGELLSVTSRRGTATAPARISRRHPAGHGVHAVSTGPVAGRANTVTNPALDPTSKMPEFKVCAVRVERREPRRRDCRTRRDRDWRSDP